MANSDALVVYDEQVTRWLRTKGYPHPSIHPSNRLPTVDDISWLTMTDPRFTAGYHGGRIDVSDQDDHGLTVTFHVPSLPLPHPPGLILAVRNVERVGLRIITRLSQRSGQVWVYPASGDPAVIIQPGMDAEWLADHWEHAQTLAPTGWGAWEWFYTTAYG